MRCPVCPDAVLVISSREGIEIDHCPDCRGVWLDRGELDKIIDRAAPAVVGSTGGDARGRDERPRDDRYDRDRYERPRDERPRFDSDDRYRSSSEYKKHKRRGFLDDLFDFG